MSEIRPEGSGADLKPQEITLAMIANVKKEMKLQI